MIFPFSHPRTIYHPYNTCAFAMCDNSCSSRPIRLTTKCATCSRSLTHNSINCGWNYIYRMCHDWCAQPVIKRFISAICRLYTLIDLFRLKHAHPIYKLCAPRRSMQCSWYWAKRNPICICVFRNLIVAFLSLWFIRERFCIQYYIAKIAICCQPASGILFIDVLPLGNHFVANTLTHTHTQSNSIWRKRGMYPGDDIRVQSSFKFRVLCITA